MKTLATTASTLILLAGCVGTSNVPPVQYYVLGNPPPSATGAARVGQVQTGAVLLVHPTSVSAFYDTQRLVYSRAEGQRAYYQFAAWTERPGHAFAGLLSQRLAAPLTTSGVRGDLVLHTRLEELYHDASRAPGSVSITLSAELVDRAGRLVAHQRFSRQQAVEGENGAGAVAAANRAIGAVLDDVVAWVGAAPRKEEETTASK